MLDSLLCLNIIWLIMNNWSKWSTSTDLDFFGKKKRKKRFDIGSLMTIFDKTRFYNTWSVKNFNLLCWILRI